MSEPDRHDRYQNPLTERYASVEMSRVFSARRKVGLWRRLWLALAEAQQELGLPITDEQLDQMRAHLDDINFDVAAAREKDVRHDVMAHVYAFGRQCPAAKPIIHLGATSCFVGDNADLVQIREALGLVAGKLAAVIHALATFAAEHRALAALGFTHFQPAQLTTVGKRAALWCHDLVLDLEEIEHRLETLRFRGVKGTTGTQASFLALFDGDHGNVLELERRVAGKMGFEAVYPVTGQTYSRKVDAQVVAALAGVCQSAHKFANDLRLLAGLKEIEEPFEAKQVGSSAMAYKRNPMRSERINALARYGMSLVDSAQQTAAAQWLERTLDDSANRRLVIPQAFLAADAVLVLWLNVARGLVVYPEVIARRVGEELPFMATENILMAAVAAGGDRQELHERIRQHSQAAAAEVKGHGRPNDLLERLKRDGAFAGVDIDGLVDPQAFVGRAPEQVDQLIAACVEPIRRRYADVLDAEARVEV